MDELGPPEPELPLSLREATPLNSVSQTVPTNPMQLMQSVIAGGITQQNVEVFGKLLEYQRSMEDRQAEKDFNAAFCKLQLSIRHVRADKWVDLGPGKGGYGYTSYEELMKEIQPQLSANGFALRFSQTLEEGGRVTSTGTLMHENGHSVNGHFSARSGRGAPGMNETKCDTSASTIAQRECLCDMLNIVRLRTPEDDARLEGDVTTKLTDDQFEHVRQRLDEVRADKLAFLKLFSVQKLADIPAAQYQRALELLDKKERQNERDARVPV